MTFSLRHQDPSKCQRCLKYCLLLITNRCVVINFFSFCRMFFVAWIYWTTFSICHLLNCYDTNRLENDRELKFRPRSAFWTFVENTLTSCCGTRTAKQYMKQKEIMNMLFCIFLSICYYGFGIAYYSSVEQWSLVDCIYFITSTLLVCFSISC